MNNSSPIQQPSASSFPARKITRKELAAHCGLCVRSIDELTRTGVLGHYRIGKSVRYDLAEVEATLRQRFHVQPTAQAQPHADANCKKGGMETHGGGLRTSLPTSRNACDRPARGGAGCPQPAAPEPETHANEASLLETPQTTASSAAASHTTQPHA